MLTTGIARVVLAQAVQATMPSSTVPAPGSLSDTAKIFATAIVTFATGIVAFFIGQVIQYRRTREALIIGLREEAITAKEAISGLMADAKSTLPHAQTLVNAVRSKTLTAKMLIDLRSSFMFYVPSYSVLDVVSKMNRLSGKRAEREIRIVIKYLDRWSTLCLMEKAYSEAHARMVELSAKIDATEQVRREVTADDVECCLEMLCKRFQELLDAAREVENLKP